MWDQYNQHITSLGQAIQQQKQNLQECESKLIINDQKIINIVQSLESFSTPSKKSKLSPRKSEKSSFPQTPKTEFRKNIGLNNNDGNLSKQEQTTKRSVHDLQSIKKTNHKSPNAVQQNPQQITNDPNTDNANKQIISQQLKNCQQQIDRLNNVIKEREDEAFNLENQFQKNKEESLGKIKELQVERGEEKKQLLGYLSTSCKVTDLLEEQSAYTKEVIQKCKLEWEQEVKNNLKVIETLQTELKQKNTKIEQLLEQQNSLNEQIVRLQQDLEKVQQNLQKIQQNLQISEEKCKKLQQIVQKNNQLIKNYKQDNILIKLQNKSLHTDNRVLIYYLQKIIQHKLSNNWELNQNVLQNQQLKAIKKFYTQQFASTKYRYQKVIPSEKNQLSNKVKFQRIYDEYRQYQIKSTTKIEQLQSKLRNIQIKLQQHNNEVRVFQTNLKKMTELRDIDRQQMLKGRRLISQYEQQLQQITNHNEILSNQINRLNSNVNINITVNQKIKQKVGCIVLTPKNTTKRKKSAKSDIKSDIKSDKQKQ